MKVSVKSEILSKNLQENPVLLDRDELKRVVKEIF